MSPAFALMRRIRVLQQLARVLPGRKAVTACPLNQRSRDLELTIFRVGTKTAWNGQLDLRARRWATEDFVQPADSRGPLSHSGEAPVSLSPRVQNLRIHSASVVTNPHGQATADVFEF